jgi:hypothetical protein
VADSKVKYVGKVAIFTVVEAGAIALRLVVGGFLGRAILLVGFLVEHVISYNVRNFRPLLKLRDLPGPAIVLLGILEYATWDVWFYLAGTAPIGSAPVPVPVYLQGLAFVVLAVGLILGHGVELNVVRGFPPFTRYKQRLKESLDITGIESVTGTVWLKIATGGRGILAFLVLFAGLLGEHLVSGNKRIT